MQEAKIEALMQYTSARLADAQGVSPDEVHNTIHQLVRKVYDQQILKLGDRHPQKMEELDLRPLVDEGERMLWEFPEFPL